MKEPNGFNAEHQLLGSEIFKTFTLRVHYQHFLIYTVYWSKVELLFASLD